MKRKFPIILLLIPIFILSNSCVDFLASKELQYFQICGGVNEGSTVEAKGFLQFGSQVLCLKTSDSQRDCAFNLAEKANSVSSEVIVNLPEGAGNNQVETPDTGKFSLKAMAVFNPDQVKIRLNDGTLIVPRTEGFTSVVVTGKIMLDKDGKRECSLYAAKLEKGE